MLNISGNWWLWRDFIRSQGFGMMSRCQQLLSRTGQLHIPDDKVQGSPMYLLLKNSIKSTNSQVCNSRN